MSFFPVLKKMGEVIPSVKRGASGPSPSRSNKLWDTKAAKSNKLTIMDKDGQVLCSTKPSEIFTVADQFGGVVGRGLEVYRATRLARFMKWADEVEAPRLRGMGMNDKRITRELGRTFAKRYHGEQLMPKITPEMVY